MGEKENDLKSRILSEMTSDYTNILDRNFDIAKQFIRLSKDGKVEVINRGGFRLTLFSPSRCESVLN